MNTLKNLQPQPLWNFFEQICQIPRPSKKEGKIREFLLHFAALNHLEVLTDEVGNVLIKKPASRGLEKAPVVILQTHLDMVCEKNSDKNFDFETDAIEPVIDGGWVKANGTTLGADCGIGIAAQMAVLSSSTIQHGPLECFFTVDEETGLTGAFALKPGFLGGEILLNLDSEDEGEMFIGCAGGVDTVATLTFKNEKVPDGSFALKFSVSGLSGGHSGDDINKGRGNAIKILTRFLLETAKKYSLGLAWLNGGNLRNAIAREAFALAVVPHSLKESVVADFNIFAAEMDFEFQYTEPGLKLAVQSEELPEFIVDEGSRDKLLNVLMACPHGVLEMSSRMAGMVETSTNLASVKFIGDGRIKIATSQRSEIETRKQFAAQMVESAFILAGAEVVHSDGYPGWAPSPGSKILETTVESYKRLFGTEPIVRSIHAGLECGLFLEKYPTLDMVSFGPTIRNAHSPNEQVEIATVGKFWKHLVDVLENIR